MKNLLLMLIIFTCACNTVKKSLQKENTSNVTTVDLKKDSTHVSEDLTKLHKAFYKINDKTISVDFAPSTSSTPGDVIRFNDSNGTTTIDMGNFIPSTIMYHSNNTQLATVDSAHTHADSAVDKSNTKKAEAIVTQIKIADKKTSRFPWYLIVAGLIFIVTSYMLYKHFFGFKKL
ncbi:MAG: hypothetical protein ABI921_12470 [Panacibacter sp.]